MVRKETRTFLIDGDALKVEFRYDEEWKVWLGNYPYFEDEPRYTPSGRPWRNVIHEGCPYASATGESCSVCVYLQRQSPGDMIGVCFHEGYQLLKQE